MGDRTVLHPDWWWLCETHVTVHQNKVSFTLCKSKMKKIFSKLQYNAITHPLGLLKLKSPAMPSVGQDVDCIYCWWQWKMVQLL